jgi:predicted membrane protein
MSHIDLDRDFSSSGEDEYVTDNYESARGRMNIRISSSMGNITVRRP